MLKLKRPWTRQPQFPAAIHPELREPRIVWTGSSAYRPQPATGMPTVLDDGSPPLSVGTQGIQFSANAGNGARVEFTSSAETIFRDTSRATIAMVRRHRDTTARALQTIGYLQTGAPTNRVLLSAPYSDGNVYWDFGNLTTGRLSVAWGTKTTDWHTLVVVAGPGKGREIWRNGVRLASNGNTAVCTPTGRQFCLGSVPFLAYGDNEDVALCVVSNAEWSNSEIVAWSQNPWGRSFAPQQIILPTPAAAGYTHPTLSAATATEIGTTSFKPRVTYTFA